MVTDAQTSANAIIAQALEKAGVPQTDISLPAETETTKPVSVPPLDGGVKGQTVGEGKVEEPTLPVPGTESPESVSAEPTEQPLSKADMETAINKAASQFQSIVDRNMNRLNLQMNQTVGAFNQFFQSQADASIAGLSGEDQVQARLNRLEKGGSQPAIQIPVEQPIDAQPVTFYQQCVSFLDAAGIKADDSRIDWANEPGITAQVGFNRLMVSVKSILVADQTKAIQELKASGAKIITKVRKQTGVDQIQSAKPGGTGTPDTAGMTPMQKIELGYKQQAIANQVNQ